MYKVCLQVPARFAPGPGVRRTQHNDFIMTGTLMPDPCGPAFCSANGGALAESAGDLFYTPLRQERHRRTSSPEGKCFGYLTKLRRMTIATGYGNNFSLMAG